MKLLRYNKDTKQLAVEVKTTLTDGCIEMLNWLSKKEHGQTTFEEILGINTEDESEEQFDARRERWDVIHYLQECFLVEEKAIGPKEAVKEVFQITDSGKLVLKIAKGELNNEGTTYA